MALNSNTEQAFINTTANSGTITLPPASSSQGRVITFKDAVGRFGVNALTLVCSGTDRFEDGASSKVLRENYGIIQVVASGTTWYILTGTQQNTVSVSTVQGQNISSLNISSANLLVSSFNNTIYQQSSLVYFNSNIFAGSRVYPATNLNSSRFSPQYIQNLVLWLDGADPFNNGTIPAQSTLMSNWIDKSPFQDNAIQTLAGNRPNYNTNGFMNFNGSNAFFNLTDISFVVNTSFSGFIVEQRQTANLANLIISGTNTINSLPNSALHFGYISPSIRFGFGANDLNATAPSFTTLATEPFRIWSFVFNNSGRFIYLNGTLQNSDTNRISLIATQFGLIGSNTFGVATPLYGGNIREIIFTRPSIDGFQRQQTEGYLAWKWGLQANLPASHPFRNAPPS